MASGHLHFVRNHCKLPTNTWKSLEMIGIFLQTPANGVKLVEIASGHWEIIRNCWNWPGNLRFVRNYCKLPNGTWKSSEMVTTWIRTSANRPKLLQFASRHLQILLNERKLPPDTETLSEIVGIGSGHLHFARNHCTLPTDTWKSLEMIGICLRTPANRPKPLQSNSKTRTNRPKLVEIIP